MKQQIIILLSLGLMACGGGSSSDATQPRLPDSESSGQSDQGAGKTDKDTQAPVITLRGDKESVIFVGEHFVDEGAEAIDNLDGSVPVLTEGEVNPLQPGTYAVRYFAADKAGNSSTVERIIHVRPPVDQQPPVITLNGDSIVKLPLGATYQEPGASAVDNIDGAVNVTIEGGDVNTSFEGKTVIVYSAIDKMGNKSTLSRTIQVAKPKVVALNKINTLIPGATVAASVVCEYCDPEKTQYRWTIGDSEYSWLGKDLLLSKDYQGAQVKLSATVYSERGSDRDTKSITYQPSYISKFEKSATSFAALMTDGSILTWGLNWGNENFPSGIRDEVRPLMSDVIQLSGVEEYRYIGLFIAQRRNGDVFTWGDPGITAKNGVQFKAGKLKWLSGNQDIIAGLEESGLLHLVYFSCDYSVSNCGREYYQVSNVKDVRFTYGAASVLTNDNRLYTFGAPETGGDLSPARPFIKQVETIYANARSFTAVNTDGTAVSWGDPQYGGDSSQVQGKLKGIREIQELNDSYIALTHSGEVITWGSISSKDDRSQLTQPITDIKAVTFNGFAFAGLKNDGSVVTWGLPENADYGANSQGHQSYLYGINKIISLPKAFAAYRNDGRIVIWGKNTDGLQFSDVNPNIIKSHYDPSSNKHWALKTDSADVFHWSDICDVVIDDDVMLAGTEKIVTKGNYYVAVKSNDSAYVWGSEVFDACVDSHGTYSDIDLIVPYLEGAYFVSKDKRLEHFGDSTAERDRKINQIDLTPRDYIIDQSGY